MTFERAKEYVLGLARERGVGAEVIASSERTLSLSADGGRVDEFTYAHQGGLGIRVVQGGRVGYASTEALDEESLTWALDEAVANAELQQGEGATLLPGSGLGRHDLLGEGLSAPVEEKVAGVVELERGLREDRRVHSIAFSRYSESEVDVVLGSTAGADGGYRNGYAYYVAMPVMKEGDSLKQGYDFDFAKDFHLLDPTRTSQAILEKVGRHCGATPLRTGRYRAFLEYEVTATLLGLLLFNLSGKTLAEGKSRLEGKLGQRIASEFVTLVDDPTLPGGPGSRPFDAEGTPAQRTEVVTDGILRSFLHNSDTARRTGHTNTGHAARSYASPLGVAPTNFIMEAGQGFAIDDGILVTDLMGVHAGANPITGDISVQALGMRVEGRAMRPVENFALSCNLFGLLERIDGASTTTRWLPSHGLMRVPMVSVADLSFSGA
jgi:PmbA protein